MKGYRTILANTLFAVPPLLEVFASPELGAVLPANWQPWYALAVVVANVALRSVTTTPLGKKI